MRIAALIFIVLYMLVGVRYVFWVKAWEAAEEAVRDGAGLTGKSPTPPIAKWVAIVLGGVLDALLWPLNVITLRWEEARAQARNERKNEQKNRKL